MAIIMKSKIVRVCIALVIGIGLTSELGSCKSNKKLLNSKSNKREVEHDSKKTKKTTT